MTGGFLIGLDYGTQSARGVLLDAATGGLVASHTHPYRHGVMTDALPDGAALPPGWALQAAPDYTEAAEAILAALGRGKVVHGIGLGFTASSPLPTAADGTPLSLPHPGEKHAYVKLWKHRAAQPWADRINAAGGDFLGAFGGRLSAEWLLAKAAQIADEAPRLWQDTARFIEAGDWLVWQLTGHEARSQGFAAYKAQYRPRHGYPQTVVPGLAGKLAEPLPIGHPAGRLTDAWRARTGILGEAVVAVAVIDSHVALPAIGAVDSGTVVGALGTSAVFMLLDDTARPFPPGVEGVARDGMLPGFWGCEAGQAGFGDMLDWFVRGHPRTGSPAEDFAWYDAAAAALPAGRGRLVALDWWNGCRVPHADAALSGLLVGMTLQTTPAEIYRALLESLCFGARAIIGHLAGGGAPIRRIVLTSGLSARNPLLMQMMADVLGQPVHVPRIAHATAVGAAIHGAVAAGVVADYAEGARRFGAAEVRSYPPDAGAGAGYDRLYAIYQALSGSQTIRSAMHRLGD